MDSIGLVLEGGGMKGVYTAGVLEFFLRERVHFPYVIGVSAGACNASSYLSRQPERNKRVTLDYIGDPRYLSYRNWFKERSLFGMDFLFNQLPNRIVPFDFETFEQSTDRFVIGTTDAFSGEPVYYAKGDGENILMVLQASSSLPFIAKPVQLKDRLLFDGGIADPIPLEKSIADGNRKNVVVLTKPLGYRKKPLKFKGFVKACYRKYPGLVRTMINRYQVYNETIGRVETMEKTGEVYVLRPSVDLHVSRTEKDRDKLSRLYELGYQDAQSQIEQLLAWIHAD